MRKPFYSKEVCVDELIQFQSTCQSNTISFENRFLCIQELSKAIKKKNGAYSEGERFVFMKIIFACLMAPESFFEKMKNKGINELKKKTHREIDEFIRKCKDFEKEYAEVRNYSGSVDIYIKYLKDSLKNNESKKQSQKSSSLCLTIKEKIKVVLNDRIKQYNLNTNIYEDALYNGFERINNLYNDPLFIHFLPYYLFFEIAKCEGYINNENNSPFTMVQIPKEGSAIWNVRYSPLKFEVKTLLVDIKKSIWLYEQIRNVLLENLNFCSIGQKLYNSIFQLLPLSECEFETEWNNFSISDRYLSLPSIDLPVELFNENVIRNCSGAIHAEDTVFFLPIFNLEYLCENLSEYFELNEENKNNLITDFRKLYLLILKDINLPERETILQKYQLFTDNIDNKEYQLSVVMKSICCLFNPKEFAKKDVFQQSEINEAIEYLLCFFGATSEADEFECSNSISRSWRELLAYCCYKKPKLPVEINYFDPNDALVRALYSEHFEYIQNNRDVLKVVDLKNKAFSYCQPFSIVFQESIAKSLTAHRRLHLLAVKWTGLNFGIQDTISSYDNTILPRNLVPIWGYQYPSERNLNNQIINYLREHKKKLYLLLQKFKAIDKSKCLLSSNYNEFWFDFNAPLTGIDLIKCSYKFNPNQPLRVEKQKAVEELRTELAERKKELINELRKIEKNFPQEITDFHFYILVYQIISLLNEEMCHEATKLVEKIAPKI